MVLEAIIKALIKGILFLFRCVLYPFIKLQDLKKKKLCSAINDQILLLSATEVARRIRKREIRCEEVITAYIKRCKEVNPLINAIVEDRFESAVQEAQEIDDFLKSTTMDEEKLASEKPLLGLPITIKESIAIQGMSHTVGCKDAPARATFDADVIVRVRKAGAIPLLVSNTPEMCLWWHTYNKVTGTTKNPYDTRRTSGGSSGGEAALLGSGASLLGLCSDIGGSARLPALFCGIFGHKPTPNWVSSEGHKPSTNDERWTSFFTIGAMVRYATDLPLILSVIAQSDEAKMGFNKTMRLKDMNFFYMDNCGSTITTSINNDMKNAIYKLIRYVEVKHGVKVQKANLKHMESCFELSAVILLDIKDVHSMFNRTDDPKKSKSILVELLKSIFFMSACTIASMYYEICRNISKCFPRSYYNKMVEKRTLLIQEFQELLSDNGVLIFPSFISSALYPQECTFNICNYTYMSLFNTIGLPVTQCPLGFDNNQLPIGLQIVANPGCDHLAIAVAQEIEQTFGGWQNVPKSEVSAK